MNKLTALLAVLLAFCAMFWWGYGHKQRADKNAARAAAAEQLVERHEQARIELDAHLRRAEEDRERWKILAEELEKEEGSERELSPYMRRVLDSVRQ